MGGVINDIGEGIANLVGAGPSGGPLGAFKPYAQTVDDLAAVALAPATGGLSLAVPGAFAAEDAAKGNYLGAAGNVGALVGGAYNAGIGPFAPAADAAGAAGGATTGAAAPLASAGGPSTLTGDLGAGGELFPESVSSPGAQSIASLAALGGSQTGQALTAGGSLYLDSTGAGGGAPGAGASVGAAGAGSATAPSPGILGTIGNDITSAEQGVSNWWSANAPSWLGGTPSAAATATNAAQNGILSGAVADPMVQPGASIAGPYAAAGPTNPLASTIAGPVAGAAGPASAGAGGGAVGLANLFGSPKGSFLNELTTPGALLSLGGLGYEALKGQPTTPNLNNLTTEAASAFNTEQQLISGELSGQLPPGAAAGVKQGLEAAQAQIRGQFASMGLSGSSAEADALASASQASASQSFQIAQSMANQGLSLAGLSAQIYSQIIQQTLGSDQEFSSAITNFAQAAGGGAGRPIQIGGTVA